MVDFNINNSAAGRANPTGLTNFDSLLNIARSTLDRISQEVSQIVNQTQFKPGTITQEGNGIRIQIPQLSNLISGQQDVLLKTALPLDKNQPVNVQIQSSNVVADPGKGSVLRLEGQLQQATTSGNAVPQRFTAEIPINTANIQNIASGTAQSQATGDQVVRNFLPNQTTTAVSNNLSETLRAALPQTLQNVNLNTQNNFNVQINSLTAPNGQQIISNNNLQQPQSQPQLPNQLPNQPATQTPNQIIQGQVEVFPDTNEALIRTEFGTFRVTGLNNVPNGSTINFTITGQATQTNQPVQDNLLGLNPTNLQTLKLSLESSESPLQNLIRLFNSSQGAAQVNKFFPHPDDKAAYARQLMFLSSAITGNPEGWLSDDGGLVVNKLHGADTNLNRLQEVFGVLKNFAGQGQQPVSTEWSSYIIPFYDGNKLSLITLQVQRDPEGKEQQTTKNKKKFILELEQDDLGRTAIEGLYSKVEGRVNNLDVVLKTEKPVDDQFINELKGIYTDIAMAYGFAGELSFAQFTAPSPIYTDVSKILGDGIVI